MKRKWMFIIVFIIVASLSGWMYYQYQKLRADIYKVKTSYTMPAKNIYQEFVANEAAANQKYVGKVLEIFGDVSDVQVTDNAAMVLLAVGNNTGGVNCSFLEKNIILPIKGQKIRVKGRCTGFLMDVHLSEAVVVNSGN